MIIHKTDGRRLRFGPSGVPLALTPEALNAILISSPPQLRFPPAALPLRIRKLARIGFLGSPALLEGFGFHNACHELKPDNWRAFIRLAKPDYILVESCFYDSARAWPLMPLDKDNYAEITREIAVEAAKEAIPAIFWHTLDADTLEFFLPVMTFFDFVGVADERALEKCLAAGVKARPLPWAFAPEIFNPFTNFRLAEPKPMLLFDGMESMLRFAQIREKLELFRDCDLTILDSSMLVTPYNLSLSAPESLAARCIGNIPQNDMQEYLKRATAFLSLENMPGQISPVQACQALEAAACRCPVLHAGQGNEFLRNFAEIYPDARTAKERYRQFRSGNMERELAAQLAWRKVHSAHTFAHRMDTIHEWIGLDKKAVPTARASIVVPSMRPANFGDVLRNYESQTWRDKELIYIFNGSPLDMPEIPQKRDIRAANAPVEYSTGMAMNMGIALASGEYIFKFDDDDLYGDHYVADRMIHFREFAFQAINSALVFFTYGASSTATLVGAGTDQSYSAYCAGDSSYSLCKFWGATICMSRDYALKLGYQEQAYAYADVSLLYKSIFLTPASAHGLLDALNFCVVRGEKGGHTWGALRKEIDRFAKGKDVPLSAVFI